MSRHAPWSVSETVAAAFAYHDVTDDPRESGFQWRGAAPYTIGRVAFRSHIEAMATAYRRPALVTAIDFAAPGRHLLLTFDDRGKSAPAVGSEPSLVPRLVHGCRVLGRYHVKLGTAPERIAALARLEGWRTAVMVRRLKGLLRDHLPGLYRSYVRYTTREALPG